MTNIEKIIIEKGGLSSISELPNFPFSNLTELKLALDKKEISIGSNYNGELMGDFGTKSERIMHTLWLTFAILIPIVDVVLAIIFKKWILVLGVPFALLGFFSSSPFSPLKNIVSGLGGLLFIASFFFFDWHWTIIIGSMLFCQIFFMTAREQYRTTILNKCLQSEILFCYMFKSEIIFLRDNIKNRIFHTY